MAQAPHARARSIPTGLSGPRQSKATTRLEEFVRDHRRGGVVTDFFEFEKQLHRCVMELEQEILSEELARADVDLPSILIEGTTYRRVLRAETGYQTAAGEVRVMRTLYKDRADEGARAVCPVEYRLGLIEGRWTPLAAQQAAWVVAQMTPKLGEELFERVGNMTPSKSALDRLPKQLSERWESDRESFDEEVRRTDLVPDAAVTVAVSLDGVMAPMKDGGATAKRAETAAQGQQTKGPAGYREVGCGAIMFYDGEGELLRAVRMARMPEPNKATLKAILKEELGHAFVQRPDLHLVRVADGAKDNWEFLDKELSAVGGSSILDFFHAAEHLSAALGSAYGDGSVQARAMFEKHRRILLDDPRGAEKVTRALLHLRDTHPKSKVIEQTLAYFRANKHRMHYAALRENNLPIGSGVVESACKTLVTQRMKNSGMRWGPDGGQAILTFRGWSQSDRFDRAWALLAATYKMDVDVIAQVIPLHGKP